MSSSSPPSSAPPSRPKSRRELSPSPIEFDESVEKSTPSEGGTRRTLRDAFEKMKSPAKKSTVKKSKLVGEAFRTSSSPRTLFLSLSLSLSHTHTHTHTHNTQVRERENFVSHSIAACHLQHLRTDLVTQFIRSYVDTAPDRKM